MDVIFIIEPLIGLIYKPSSILPKKVDTSHGVVADLMEPILLFGI